MKEIQERKIVTSIEGINKSLGRIATYLQKIVEMKADQSQTALTVLGELENLQKTTVTIMGEREEREDDTDRGCLQSMPADDD